MVRLSFLLLFFCGIITLSKASTSEITVAHLSPGSNAKIEKDQLTDFPTSFTVCLGVYQIYSAKSISAILTINAQNERFVVSMQSAYQDNTIVYIFNKDYAIITYYHLNGTIFPLQWIMFCLSLDSLTGRIRMTLDAHELIFDKIQEDFVGLDWGPWPITFQLGPVNNEVDSRKISNFNVFSSALPIETMQALTEVGGDDCGSPGDFLRWDEVSLTLNDTAQLLKVDPKEGPCWKKSQLHLYSGELNQQECMQLCQKVGDGNSPPVGTLHQWQTFIEELEAITNQTSHFKPIWLSSVLGKPKMDEGVLRFEHWPEDIVPSTNVWRDYFTGQPSDSFMNVPSSANDRNFGHCMKAWFNGKSEEKEAMRMRQFCSIQDKVSCACQKKSRAPILRFLGLCGASILRGIGSDRIFGIRALQDVLLNIQLANI